MSRSVFAWSDEGIWAVIGKHKVFIPSHAIDAVFLENGDRVVAVLLRSGILLRQVGEGKDVEIEGVAVGAVLLRG